MRGNQYACLRYTVEEGSHRFCAGVLCWDTLTGIVESVAVHPDYRRQGIARQLLAIGRAYCGHIRHSENLTPDGHAWAHSVG